MGGGAGVRTWAGGLEASPPPQKGQPGGTPSSLSQLWGPGMPVPDPWLAACGQGGPPLGAGYFLEDSRLATGQPVEVEVLPGSGLPGLVGG